MEGSPSIPLLPLATVEYGIKREQDHPVSEYKYSFAEAIDATSSVISKAKHLRNLKEQSCTRLNGTISSTCQDIDDLLLISGFR